MDIVKETDPLGILSGFFQRPQDLEVLRSSVLHEKSSDSIPKIIHQIWLGSPLPPRLARLRNTWIKNHPDWEFRLWTDKEVTLSGFECEDLVSSTDCYGQKSDLLRAEIIYRYGGVYVDLDYESFRPLELSQLGKMFATLRWIPQANLGWPQVFPQPLIVCNSLFGSEAGSDVVGDYLRKAREVWNDSKRFTVAQGELDRISRAAMGGEKRVRHLKETALRTYLPFHDCVWKAATRFKLLPPIFLNPVIPGWKGIYLMPQFWSQWRKSNGPLPKMWKYSRRSSRTIAKHWSSASWLN